MTELPKHGEVWIKKPCDPIHRMGWSMGNGIYLVDRTTHMDWGCEGHIECGCLVRYEGGIYTEDGERISQPIGMGAKLEHYEELLAKDRAEKKSTHNYEEQLRRAMQQIADLKAEIDRLKGRSVF